MAGARGRPAPPSWQSPMPWVSPAGAVLRCRFRCLALAVQTFFRTVKASGFLHSRHGHVSNVTRATHLSFLFPSVHVVGNCQKPWASARLRRWTRARKRGRSRALTRQPWPPWSTPRRRRGFTRLRANSRRRLGRWERGCRPWARPTRRERPSATRRGARRSWPAHRGRARCPPGR